MNPTEQFRAAVESALIRAKFGKDAPENLMSPSLDLAEALASIQAATVELLEGLEPIELAGYPGNKFISTKEIDQLIKDLSNV